MFNFSTFSYDNVFGQGHMSMIASSEPNSSIPNATFATKKNRICFKVVVILEIAYQWDWIDGTNNN